MIKKETDRKLERECTGERERKKMRGTRTHTRMYTPEIERERNKVRE